MDVVWGVVGAGRVGASGGVRMGVVGRLVRKGRAVGGRRVRARVVGGVVVVYWVVMRRWVGR